MTYTKQTWTDGSLATPLTGARLNNMEQGIFDAGTGGANRPTMFDLMGIYNVKDYGCAVDNVTNDGSAFQSLLNTVGLAGGGVIYIPPGTLYHNVAGSSQGAIYVRYNNITVIGAGRDHSKIRTGPACVGNGGFVVQGQYKNQLSPVLNDNMPEFHSVYYNLSGTSLKGASFLQLATPSDAANLNPQDWIYIKTGMTISGPSDSVGANNPDAEINQVLSANSTTGVVQLKHPTKKSYQQEWYISGGTGKTDVINTGSPAPYCIVPANTLVIENFAMRHLTFDHSVQTGTGNIFHMQTITDLDMENMRIIGKNNFIAGNNLMSPRFHNLRCHSTATPAQNCSAIITTGRGSSDIIGDMLEATSEGCVVAMIFAEGTSGALITNAIYRSSDQASAVSQIPLHIGSRSRDIIMRTAIAVNSGPSGTPVVGIDPGCLDGGMIDGHIVDGVNQTNAFRVQSPGWRIGMNYAKAGAISLGSPGNTPNLQPGLTYVLQGRMDIATLANSTMVLGDLPINCVVTGVTIDVVTAFTSTGTKDVNIGYSGLDTAYVSSAATAIDSGSASDWGTAGGKAVVRGAKWGRVETVVRSITAKYIGTSPTVGKAIVVVTYVYVQGPT